MSNLSWAPALILTTGVLLVFFGVIAFVLNMIAKIRQHHRQMRQAQRSFAIMQDLKDLNS